MDALSLVPITFNHVNAGLVAGTTSTYTTTAATVASIKGAFATALAAQTNTASPTTDATTGLAFVPLTANQACALVWGVTAAGAIALMQGPIVNTEVGVTTTAGNFINAPQFPSIPDTVAPIGYQIVRTSPTGSSFTPGTTAWAASGITATTIKNISTLPARPQIS
jgi:hypothetical protein